MDYQKKIDDLRENIQECKVNKTTLINRKNECETELSELEAKCKEEHDLSVDEISAEIEKLETSMNDIVEEIEKELS